jgi:hypothetical protein
MVMLDPGELIFPVSAGPVRGPRYARLLTPFQRRKSARAIAARPRHRLDIRPTSTNRDQLATCSVVINVYARTRLNLQLKPDRGGAFVGGHIGVEVVPDIQRGVVSQLYGFSRLSAPAHDLAALVRREVRSVIPRAARLEKSEPPGFDAARILARLESRSPRLAETRDEELRVVTHHGGPLHVHVNTAKVPAPHNISMWIEGLYNPGGKGSSGHDGHGTPPDNRNGQRFIRVLSTSIAVAPEPRKKTAARSVSAKKKSRPKK